MFYDLNIPLPEVAGKPNGRLSGHEWAQIAQTIERARELGYSIVALNQTIHGRLMPEHLQIWQSVPQFANSQLSWTSVRVADTKDGIPRGEIRVLRRLTAVISDATQGHSLSGALASEYDLVAVRPTSEKTLLAACNGTWEAVDMVALDMGSRWGFLAKQKIVAQALALGVSFEVAYQPALESARQQWVCNTSNIVRVTRGRGMVWTSGARQPLELRTPYDIANLGDALQLNGDLSKRAISANARAVLIHAFTRTGTLRAVASIH
ncbi:RNA-binding RNA processing protein rpp1 [Coemansia brasiliensis]|uniref:RNA-binding RNA processing protein rpp1 n=1 Tax=Coemansia brasiliensis TaxID=2650707 RepID=A0A9W8I5X8_9FUNG|nr:RNA-binding RNA processing protein rpp1 [Coemansia brasiliensis]